MLIFACPSMRVTGSMTMRRVMVGLRRLKYPATVWRSGTKRAAAEKVSRHSVAVFCLSGPPLRGGILSRQRAATEWRDTLSKPSLTRLQLRRPAVKQRLEDGPDTRRGWRAAGEEVVYMNHRVNRQHAIEQ